MRVFAALCLLALVGGVSCQAPSGGAPDLLWPKPQNATFMDAVSYNVGAVQITITGHSSDTLTGAVNRFKSLLFPSPSQLTGSTFAVTIDVLTDDESLNQDTDESYNLTVTASAAIQANSVYGAMHGLTTLQQLFLRTAPSTYNVYGADIVDFPRFKYRAHMMDTARHYKPIDLIKFNLNILSLNKFNVLHWHIVDDQSFPYQSKLFPDMSGKGSYDADAQNHIYTIAQIKDIVEYARMRGIRVVPEFDTPGHTQAWGLGIPDLLTPCYSGGKPDGSYGPINPILDSTYTFLEAFFKELTTVFPDHFFHLGGDEVSFNCWQSNPDIQAFMKKNGWTEYNKLETYYEQKVLDIVGGLNKSYVVWQEIFDNKNQIKNDTVIGVWKGGWQNELAAVTAAGFNAVLSSPWYLNYISYGDDIFKYYDVEPTNFTGTAEQKKKVIGLQACMWSEYVDATNEISRTWPRLSAVGERMWSAETVRDHTDATTRLHNHRCRMVDMGIPAEPILGPSFCPTEYAYTVPSWV